jgi:hypothetical protein
MELLWSMQLAILKHKLRIRNIRGEAANPLFANLPISEYNTHQKELVAYKITSINDIKKYRFEMTLPFDYFIKGLSKAKFNKAMFHFTAPSWYNSVTNSVTYAENTTGFNEMSLSSSKPIRPKQELTTTNSVELNLEQRIYIHPCGRNRADSIGVAIIFTKFGPTNPEDEAILTIKAFC